jgi:hypothetical protein
MNAGAEGFHVFKMLYFSLMGIILLLLQWLKLLQPVERHPTDNPKSIF